MSTIYAPITEVVSASVVAEATSQFKSMMAAAAPVKSVQPLQPAQLIEASIQPAPSFLIPKICSWISTPYYPITIQSVKFAETVEIAEAVEFAERVEIAEAVEFAETVASAETAVLAEPDVLEEAYPIEGFDINKLAAHYLKMAHQSVKEHVHGVIELLEGGGDAACTFGNIFLNDPALQRTVICGLMNEPGNPLSEVEFQHKELALRLACCGAARDVARLVLAEA